MDIDFVSALLLLAGLTVLLLCTGLFLLSIANVSLSVRELNLHPGFLLSRSFIELNICVTSWLLMGWALSNGGDVGLFLGTSEYVTVGTTSYELWFYQITLLFVSVTIFSNATLPRLINGITRASCVIYYSLVVFPVLYHWLWSVGGWASAYRSSYQDDLLRGCGVIDSAGSSIIHMAAGCAGLVLLWIAKPRISGESQRLAEQQIAIKMADKADKHPHTMPLSESTPHTPNTHSKIGKSMDEMDKSAHSKESARNQQNQQQQKEQKEHYKEKKNIHISEPPAVEKDIVVDDFKTRQMISTITAPLLIWVGFIGLNAATNLPGDNSSIVGGKRIVNTLISGAGAMLLGYCYSNIRCLDSEILIKKGDVKLRAMISMKCFLSGLISISASCSVVEMEGALAIGIISAIICIWVCKVQRSMGVDVGEMSVSVHLVAGVWGLLSPGLLASQPGYEMSFADSYEVDGTGYRSQHCRGVFYGGSGAQLSANCVFLLAVLSWSVCSMVLCIGGLKLCVPSAFAEEPLDLDPYDVARLHALNRNNAETTKKKIKTQITIPRVKGDSLSPQNNMKKTEIIDDFERKYGYSWDYVLVLPVIVSVQRDNSIRREKMKKNAITLYKVEEIEKTELDRRMDGKYDGRMDGRMHNEEKIDEIDSIERIETPNKINQNVRIEKKLFDDKKDDKKVFDGKGKVFIVESPMKSNLPKANNGNGNVVGNDDEKGVFTYSNESESLSPIEIIRALLSAGLETYQYYSLQRDEIIVKIRVPLKLLRSTADMQDYMMLLDEESCITQAQRGDKDARIKPFLISHGIKEQLTQMRPHQYIYAPYDRKRVTRKLFTHKVHPKDSLLPFPTKKHINAHQKDLKTHPEKVLYNPSEAHPFDTIHRVRLLLRIIEGRGTNYCGLHLQSLIEHKCLLTHFPLHEEGVLYELADDWLSLHIMPWEQPNTRIRDYFGEHVAMYFTFLAHYTTFLMILSIAGVGVAIHVIVIGVLKLTLYGALQTVYSIPAFCIFVALWTEALLETWKRKEVRQAYVWGMEHYEESELDRFSFQYDKGVFLHNSHIDGKVIHYFPLKEARRRVRFSIVITALMILIDILSVAGVFYLKFYLTRVILYKNGDVIAEVVNAVQIQLLATIYSNMAKTLTEHENCRTDTQYEDSLIIKFSAFNFVNSYASSFYIAFIKKAVGDFCTDSSCMGELAQTHFIIFVSQTIMQSLSQTISPKVSLFLKNRRESAGCEKGREFSKVEKEYNLEEYDQADSIDDYKNVCVQFGNLSLFVAAVPFLPLLACIKNFLEIRVDGWKLITGYRRPFPSGCEDIGTWQAAFQITSVIAVFTNAGLVFYTAEYFVQFDSGIRLALAAVSIMVTFLLRYLLGTLVFPRLKEIDIQRDRREFIILKLISKVADDDTDDEHDPTDPIPVAGKKKEEGVKPTLIWVEDQDHEIQNPMKKTL